MEKEIKRAVSNDDIASCWEAMFLLRPMLKKETFFEQIKNMQQEGYVLLFIKENNKTVAVAGYRFLTMLYCGKMLYIDDLYTLEDSRGKGYASLLLHYLCDIAKQHACASIQLDSGAARTAAHKLYFKENFTISALHFHKSIQLKTHSVFL